MKMEFRKLLTKDTSYVLAMKLDYKSLLNMCQASKTFYEWIYKDEIFWQNKTIKDYPFLLEFKPKKQSYRIFYLEMVYYISKVEAKYGIPYISTQGYNPKNFYERNDTNEDAFIDAMFYASGAGDIEIIKLLIEKGATKLNLSMLNAAEEGHIEIVKFLIEKGAKNVNMGMRYAASRGHINIVKLMIEKGATDFKGATKAAEKSGHLEIVQYLKFF